MYSPMNIYSVSRALNMFLGSDHLHPTGPASPPLELLRDRNLHTEFLQSWKNPFDFLVEHGLWRRIAIGKILGLHQLAV